MSADDTPTEQSLDSDEAVGSDATADATDRDVVVPLRVYKAVMVFTTLFAVMAVVGGFIVLDTATNEARSSVSNIDPLLGLAGLGLIVAGAAVYAFSTRFRTDGMGKSKDDTDESSDNG